MKTFISILLSLAIIELLYSQGNSNWYFAKGSADAIYKPTDIMNYTELLHFLEEKAKQDALSNAFGETFLAVSNTTIAMENFKSDISFIETSSSSVTGRWVQTKKISIDSIPVENNSAAFIKLTITGIVVEKKVEKIQIDSDKIAPGKTLEIGGNEVRVSISMSFINTTAECIDQVSEVQLNVYKHVKHDLVYVGNLTLSSHNKTNVFTREFYSERGKFQIHLYRVKLKNKVLQLDEFFEVKFKETGQLINLTSAMKRVN